MLTSIEGIESPHFSLPKYTMSKASSTNTEKENSECTQKASNAEVFPMRKHWEENPAVEERLLHSEQK